MEGIKMTRIYKNILICTASIVVVVMLMIGGLFFLRYYGTKNERSARECVARVIDSINTKTDYYKTHCREMALTQIEKHSDKISDTFEIRVLDFDFWHYEYEIIFNQTKKFYVAVSRGKKDNFLVLHFRPRRPANRDPNSVSGI